ncbi:L-threonylcarbamoyladenylate synthase [Phaeocystidibacter marisrubri]|uniref:Threonylcarbamoyl-AMP synthase n=1 Tax=Phaeocystidibacter marisrubri TaxID=1577780 RepID=A0A6L3ZID5_9FLAO|nr:L-threonylcarbamoyladenylate synthase [Phaeocystidibacter marisrubri]KAB2817235.1 threonylcarbamoyl-AMP synthase [Phaeocystidibacter marisrubri]GGH76310.1 threonylcarbamoyl-AMP synthase [Phaeocystidibacter marisrubri]
MRATIGTSISEAIDHLNKNEVVAIPTETVYGLAGNALERESVIRIFETKARPAFDPLIVHTHSVNEFHKYADVPAEVIPWVQKLSPGPITYILRKKPIIPDLVTSGHPTVGLRIPNHPLTLELLRRLDYPLAAPSANPFGYVSPTKASHVADQLGGKIPYILDGGDCEVGIESTIIDLSGEKPVILRLGGYELSELESIIGMELNDIRLSSSAPHAPGMLHSHYAPGVKLFTSSIDDLLPSYSIEKIGAISFTNPIHGVLAEKQLILSKTGDLREAAKNLFRHLRALDNMEIEAAVVEMVPNEGLGKAINDRLKRALYKSN